MDIYRLRLFYDKNVFCKKGCFFKKMERYFIGELGLGLEAAKKYLIMAKENDNIYAADIYLCYTDFESQLIPDELIKDFIRD